MAARSIEAGRAFMRLSLDDKAFRKGLANVSKRLNAVGGAVSKFGADISGLGAGLAAPLAAAVGVFAKVGDDLDKLSSRTGVSVEALSQFAFAAEQSGQGMEVFEKALIGQARAVRGLERNLSTQVEAFETLGLTLTDLQGLAPEDQFGLIASRLDGLADPTQKAAVALEVFGKSGQKLVPLFGQIENLRDEARELGLTISGETAGQAAEFTDALNRVRKVVTRIAVEVGASLGPTIADLATGLASVAKSAIEWAENNRPLIKTVAAIAAGIIGLGSLITGIGVSFLIAGAAVSGFASVFGVIAGVAGAVLSPLGLVAAAIAGIGFAILKYTPVGSKLVAFLSDAFGGLADTVKTAFGVIAQALQRGDTEAAGKALMAGLRVIFLTGVEQIRRIWASIQGFLISIWSGAVGGVIKIFAGLRAAWASLVAGMKNAWASLSGAVQNGWATAQNYVTAGVLGLQKLITEKLTGEEFTIDVELNQADKRLAETQQRIADNKRKALADSQAVLQEDLARIQSDRDGALDVIAAKEKQRQAGVNARLNEAREAAAKAREELKALAAQSQDAAGEGEKVKNATGGLKDILANFGEDVSANLGDTFSSAGTFRGAVAGLQFAGSSSVADKQLNVAEEQLQEQKRTNQHLADEALGGVKVTP